MARSKAKAIPIIKERIIKNPNTLFPVNWEERLDEGEYWYEDEPVFDSEGNCTMKRNLYIVQKEVVGFYRSKKTGFNKSKYKPLFDLKREEEI